MSMILSSSTLHATLHKLTTAKIAVECNKTSADLWRLTLLCNTHDAQSLRDHYSYLEPTGRRVVLSTRKPPPPYQLSAYLEVEPSVTECPLLSEDLDFDEEKEQLWSESFQVMSDFNGLRTQTDHNDEHYDALSFGYLSKESKLTSFGQFRLTDQIQIEANRPTPQRYTKEALLQASPKD